MKHVATLIAGVVLVGASLLIGCQGDDYATDNCLVAVCPGGQKCVDGVCVDACKDVSCEEGKVCEDGVCVKEEEDGDQTDGDQLDGDMDSTENEQDTVEAELESE